MTAAERLEEARDYVEKTKKGTIDIWHSKEQGCQMFGVSYVVWDGKKNLGKIMKSGPDLVAVVDFLKEKEKFSIANGVVPKMEAPAPLAPPEPAFTFCPVCMMSQQAGPAYCNYCGARLY